MPLDDEPTSLEEALFSLRIVKLQNEKLKQDWVRQKMHYENQIESLQAQLEGCVKRDEGREHLSRVMKRERDAI